MKHNGCVPYFKEIINLPVLLGTEDTNYKLPAVSSLSEWGDFFHFHSSSECNIDVYAFISHRTKLNLWSIESKF